MLIRDQTAAGASDRVLDLHAKQRRRRLRDFNIPRWHGRPSVPPLLLDSTGQLSVGSFQGIPTVRAELNAGWQQSACTSPRQAH